MPRLRCEPLGSGDDLPVLDERGRVVCALPAPWLAWRCRDRALDARVIALAPPTLPEAEPTEPVAGALARLSATLRAQAPRIGPALIMLRAPCAVVAAHDIAVAAPARLFGIATDEDEAAWDAALALGMAVYGVRGACALDASRADAASAFSALAYGAFACEDGLALAELAEDRVGARWRVAGADADRARAEVVVRGGFVAATIAGASGEWRDRGDEGSVRLVVRGPGGACWTQPRFVAPRAAGATHA